MRFQPLKISIEVYSVIFMLCTLLFFNSVFFEKIYQESNLIFTIGTFIVLWPLGTVACLLLFYKKSVKPLSFLFLITNASVFYFVKNYNVFIDDEMLRNALQTNLAETGELLNLTWFLYILFFGILPSILICFIRIDHRLALRNRIFLIFVCILVPVSLIFANFQTVAPFVRSHKHLKYQLIPVNYIGAISSFIKKYYRQNHKFQFIGQDAHFEQYWSNDKKNLIVFVVGEAARADKFSFNGYERKTNAPLEKFTDDIINFSNVTSCGTSTAVSLPCMFSKDERENFVSGSMEYTENLLDIVQRSGYNVTWVENNSDCKNLCTRINTLYPCSIHPQDHDCLDDVLLPEIDLAMPEFAQNTMIVLHQIGSHGPKYFKRYKKEDTQYEPVCATEMLNECSKEQLVNVYDNTIYYTSKILAEIIEKIQKFSQDYNVMLFYISDHGESLGENNIYLHSAPYTFAPKEQKKVPFFIWAEAKTLDELNLDKDCLLKEAQKAVSQDNVFHSLLSIGGIKTQEYKKELDLFAKCKK